MLELQWDQTTETDIETTLPSSADLDLDLALLEVAVSDLREAQADDSRFISQWMTERHSSGV